MRMTMNVVPTGRTTATVILEQEQVDAVRGKPGRGRVPLAITYEGQVFRTSISVYGGKWMMVVNEAMREGGMSPPGTYAVEIVTDTAERTVAIPGDLEEALASAGLREAWDRQSNTNRRESVRGVVEAKKPETCASRVEKVVTALSQ